jgi:hypothetical protein
MHDMNIKDIVTKTASTINFKVSPFVSFVGFSVNT